MEPADEFVWITIAMVVSFIISLFVFFNAKRKWLGCILQFFTFIALLLFSGLLFGMYRESVDSSNESAAMVGVRLIEEDRDCRYETQYWMNPDDTYYYEFDKGSNKHRVEPCGNDSYSGKGTFIRIDSIYAIQARSNPDFVIYFDLDSQKVTPVYGNDIIEVIDTNWECVNDYFKNH